jgi:hypothetical protein
VNWFLRFTLILFALWLLYVSLEWVLKSASAYNEKRPQTVDEIVNRILDERVERERKNQRPVRNEGIVREDKRK